VSHLEKPAVSRVRDALIKANQEDTIVEFADTARSADDAAKSVGCDLGAIVKSLVFSVDNRFVMALVAGDHKCIEDHLPNALKIKGAVRRPQASEVKAITGFTIGGVAPVGLLKPIPTVIDGSLKRFDKIYAAAGHPHCVFSTSLNDLARMTDGIISYGIASPNSPEFAYSPKFSRSKTFSK
jgi:prolyl-tRNA editing enzyme YbaK/EbsC (Cys-tRNA(Pro) deacylase)